MKKAFLFLTVLVFSTVYAMGGPPAPPPEAGPPSPPPGPEEVGAPPPYPVSQRADRREVWRKFMREHPREARQMRRICQEYPELGCGRMMGMGMRGMRGMRGRMAGRRERGMGEENKFDPELAAKREKLEALKTETRELGRKYQETKSASEKKKIETQIRAKLGEIYKLKLDIMRARIKRVEERLKRVRAMLASYEKDKKGVIDSWFDQVTGKARYKKF